MKWTCLALVAVLMPAATAPAFANCGGAFVDHIFVDRFDPIIRPVVGDLVFTEVMARPVTVPEADGEWFELVNTSAQPLELCSCFVGNLASLSTVLPPTRVRPGERLVMGRNRDPASNGGVAIDVLFGFSLANGNGQLFIQCDANLLDSVNWLTTVIGRSWSLDPDFTDPVANDDPAAWCFAPTPAYNTGGDAGTPGLPNVEC